MFVLMFIISTIVFGYTNYALYKKLKDIKQAIQNLKNQSQLHQNLNEQILKNSEYEPPVIIEGFSNDLQTLQQSSYMSVLYASTKERIIDNKNKITSKMKESVNNLVKKYQSAEPLLENNDPPDQILHAPQVRRWNIALFNESPPVSPPYKIWHM